MPWSWRPFCFCLILATLIGHPGSAAEGVPATPALAGIVTVAQGKELVIPAGGIYRATAPRDGVTVQGRLVARGTAERPVLFTGPAGWAGITVTGEAILDHVVIEGAAVGVKVAGGVCSLAGSRVASCATGIDVDQSGQVTVRDTVFDGNARGVVAGLRGGISLAACAFRSSAREAVTVTHQGKGSITGCSFLANATGVRLWQKNESQLRDNLLAGNRVGILADQVEGPLQIEGNIISGNDVGVSLVNGSSPSITGNEFERNGVAVEMMQVAKPSISGNDFVNNRTALLFTKRSSGMVERNRFEGNDRGIFCDFSSYPRMVFNNFQRNRLSFSLGDNQSFDWESREGGGRTSPAKAASPPPLAGPVVDATSNWWGADTTLEMENEGGNADISSIDDGHDRKWVTYEGYQGKSYRLDLVSYKPWLPDPVKGAGAPLERLRGLAFPGAANPLAGR